MRTLGVNNIQLHTYTNAKTNNSNRALIISIHLTSGLVDVNCIILGVSLCLYVNVYVC